MVISLLSFGSETESEQFLQATREGNSGSRPQSDLRSWGSQPGHPVQVFLRLFSRLRLMVLLRRLPIPGDVAVTSSWYELSSSAISLRLGLNRFAAIFCLAMVITSRILVRNSMAAGGGA